MQIKQHIKITQNQKFYNLFHWNKQYSDLPFCEERASPRDQPFETFPVPPPECDPESRCSIDRKPTLALLLPTHHHEKSPYSARLDRSCRVALRQSMSLARRACESKTSPRMMDNESQSKGGGGERTNEAKGARFLTSVVCPLLSALPPSSRAKLHSPLPASAPPRERRGRDPEQAAQANRPAPRKPCSRDLTGPDGTGPELKPTWTGKPQPRLA